MFELGAGPMSVKSAIRALRLRIGVRVSQATFYRWIAEGYMPAVRLCKTWYVKPSDLAAVVEEFETKDFISDRASRRRARSVAENRKLAVIRRRLKSEIAMLRSTLNALKVEVDALTGERLGRTERLQ